MIEETDPLIKRKDLHGRLQVTSDTVRKWIKAKKLPAPDVSISRKTMGWKRSTLRAHGVNV